MYTLILPITGTNVCKKGTPEKKGHNIETINSH
jgi:hypothetical protein